MTTFTDKEIEIIHELGQQVLVTERLLCDASDVCGELDWFVCCSRKMTTH